MVQVNFWRENDMHIKAASSWVTYIPHAAQAVPYCCVP